MNQNNSIELEEIKRKCCPATRLPGAVLKEVKFTPAGWDTLWDEVSNWHHQELQKARQDWLREEIESFRTEMKNYPMVNEPEWRRGYIEALQDQVDRYQSELDQPNT
jgi:hypothetical protein